MDAMIPPTQKRRTKRRTPRPKGLTLAKMFPNMITVAATCTGLTAVRYAMDERWEFAVGAILVAAILDALDGRMARLLNASSEFGAQLDSLSDFVAFGVSPAFILWFWGLSELGGIGWVAVLFFAVCCGLRLARFNSRIDTLPPYAYNYFQGVPAPAGAALALFPMVIGFQLGKDAVPVELAAAWLVGMALLMASELPTYSFKKLKLPPKWILPFMAGVGLLIAAIAGSPWRTLSGIGAIYLASIPMSFLTFRRLQLEAIRLQDLEDEDEQEDIGESTAAGTEPGVDDPETSGPSDSARVHRLKR